MAGEIVAPPGPVTVVEEPRRHALGALKGRRSGMVAPVERVSSGGNFLTHCTQRIVFESLLLLGLLCPVKILTLAEIRINKLYNDVFICHLIRSHTSK